MSSEWYYDSPSTVAGALQRGLGRGAALVRDPEDVMACVRRDHRFWWIFDDRTLYLARLVRDLGIDAGRIAAGLARIGGDAARAAVPKVRRAWFTPHSYERAATLKAFTALDPDAATRQLSEGLWDCEADVREFAAARAPLSPAAEHRLAVLRDDPLETPEVRAAATTRLAA
ncbi:hypothetical protein ACQEVZ_51225 [Dactylosporangium sp. CA-152071]|uniref:hypothetical protein n=1 Tax=Dactylosporangium sp. CA-152071 TaxID=3239933 RepID=UPI003D8C837C